MTIRCRSRSGATRSGRCALVAAAALADGADTLITCGGVQSNHARVTAITAAKLGLRCILVVNASNGQRPARITGNALLDQLRAPRCATWRRAASAPPEWRTAAAEVQRAGGRPYVIPLGASTPLGAAAFVSAVDELLAQMDPPDVIVHATSSGGTQAGLVAGCASPASGPASSASAPTIRRRPAGHDRSLLPGLESLLDVGTDRFAGAEIEVDDTFVGEGYGVPTDAAREALLLCARSEGMFLDTTYTAKAMAGLIARVQAGVFTDAQTVLFWHTGGQVGLFA